MIKPTLSEELARFEAIASHIGRHEAPKHQAAWFAMDKRAMLKRLAGLGVIDHQPAITASMCSWMKLKRRR